MYYQVNDSQGGRSAAGTGIGLTVSKRLAQHMGGDIHVESEVRTWFYLYAFHCRSCD